MAAIKKVFDTIVKWMLNIISNIYVHKYPPFFVYHMPLPKVDGMEQRAAVAMLKPGDIVLRNYDSSVTAMLTPGEWSHVGIYAGNNEVVHAIGEGVVIDDPYEFFKADRIAIVRIVDAAQNEVNEAIDKAYSLLGKGYDFEFEEGDDEYYCSELTAACYPRFLLDEYGEFMGKTSITPDAIYDSKDTVVVYETKRK